MKRLIVNADDLGLTSGVTSGIIEAHERGIVTSASLMANLPGAARTVRLVRNSPGLGVGLHLNLTAGSPLRESPALTWRDGTFLTLFRVVLRVSIAERARQQAWAEMEAQLARARKLGLKPDHLDSHHHIHVFPALRGKFLEMARSLGVPARIPDEPLTLREWRRDPLAGLASFFAGRMRGRKDASPSTGHTIGERLHRSAYDAVKLRAVLLDLPEGVTEFFCHPGHDDDELAKISGYTAGRERELEALTAPGLREALDEAGVELVTWREARLNRGLNRG